MKTVTALLLALISAILPPGAARAEITTVVLSTDATAQFKVAAGDAPSQTARLTFAIAPAFTPGAAVIKCVLRVVPTPQPAPPRADQDVTVTWKNNQGNETQVGQWSAYSRTTEPYTAELKPEACASGSTSALTLTTPSRYTAWDYYGGSASPAANRPRLIVTYNSPMPPRGGDFTGWKYAEPASFFSAPLWSSPGATLLANPVGYDGAVYVIAGSPSGRLLYRVAGPRNVASWPLDFDVTSKSFAFVTTGGRLQIITKNALRSCDLSALGRADPWRCTTTAANDQITVNEGETPAMGPDGSLYYKNVDAQGSVVARNPSFAEIWRTELKLEAVSPLALSPNGRSAYVLANVPTLGAGVTALLRFDTATGQTVAHTIFYCPSVSTPPVTTARPPSCKEPDRVTPRLQTLLQPKVVSKVRNRSTVDYVFVAGNTSDTGVLQLVAFEPGALPKLLWSREKAVAAPPVLSANDNALVVAWRDGTLTRYDWYDATPPAIGAVAPPRSRDLPSVSGVSALLVDGGDALYVSTGPALYVYRHGAPALSNAQALPMTPRTLQFTPEGALIGSSDSAIYDLSPKAAPATGWPSTFESETIYSADHVAVPASARPAPDAKRVILKGQSVSLPSSFTWPAGAVLRVHSVAP